MNFYKRHLGDYARDTGHLSLIEHGAYTMLLDWSYASERPLPETMESVFRLCRATSAAEKRAVEFVVNEFFPLVDGHRRNKRAMLEIADLLSVSETARANAHKGWQGRRNAPASNPHPSSNALQTPDSKTPELHTPALEEVLAFGRGHGLPDDRLISWHERKSNSAKHGWATVLDWRTDLLNAARSVGWGQKKNAADVVESPSGTLPPWQQVAASRRLQDLRRQLREAQDEQEALAQCGAEVPAELKKRCRELARELEGVAA